MSASKLLQLLTSTLINVSYWEIPAMAEDSSFQIFDLRKYLDRFYYLNKKPGEEPELVEFILIKLHEYMKEGNRSITSRASFNQRL